MARVLIATSAARGQINPMIALAQALKEAGHELTSLCVGGPNDQLKALKFEQVKDALLAPKDGSIKAAVDAINAQVHTLRHTLQHLSFDIAVVHPTLYGVIAACELESRKWVGASASLAGIAPPDMDTPLAREATEISDARAKAFDKFGLVCLFRHSHCVSPHGQIVFTMGDFTRELAQLPPGTQQVGPAISAQRGEETKFDWKKVNYDAPLVYAAGLSGESLEKLSDAAGSIDAQFVVAGQARPSKNVIAVPFAPQLKLLGRASVFVTSGGAASVMEAVAAGVPMLVCPTSGEEFVHAEFVRKAKNGLVAKAGDDLGEKLRVLMEAESACIKPAARLKDAFGMRDGAKAAAELIAKLAG